MRRFLLGLSLVAVSLVGVSSTASARQDRHVIIQNDSGYDIVAVYASNVGTDSWEEDMLGDLVLRDGRSARFNIDDGSGYCRYDIKLVFEDGDVIYRRAANVCELGVLRIN